MRLSTSDHVRLFQPQHGSSDAPDPKRKRSDRLFDHLVGAGVDHELELGRLFEAGLA